MITKNINKAIEILNNDDIVAIPTETVYGLAGNAFSANAVSKIFSLKKRPKNNPLIVHIKSINYLNTVAKDIPTEAINLAEKFWPGPLTLVLKKQNNIPNIVSAGKDTIAVRVPNHKLTLNLLSKIDFPLVAPSANPFSCISPTVSSHVSYYFKDKLSLVLDGGRCEKGIESTIIGFENGNPTLYRYGAISINEVEEVVGKVNIINKNNINPNAPGMFSKHYSPKTEFILTDKIDEIINLNPQKKIGLIVFKNKIKINTKYKQIILSQKGCMEEAAKNLYNAMHKLDLSNLDLIIAERLPNLGLGISINDRLVRANNKKS